ncbi:glycoside hydrolase family 31 [Phototrophicus methaneseepsis]|uniref:Glycoside hydrolase family 31 n=1 Tax=Phototrophicus methaneseepsis TaxID=2710758 RepID=A0A7S8EB53_9CHLR|nr:TIM-barrel domain-containing protein [Phototrophicus methaneseepsis]QPC83687.1 glycoside hydrolase family 31 [Phototrophicus methaneseepsis]
MQIIHNPMGQEHPYEQLPEERFPRQPLANEPFTVGIVIRPSGAARNVRVHQRISDQTLPTIEAVHQADWQAKQEEGVGAEFLERMVRIDQDVWQANLVAPAHGQTLTYWVEADGQLSEELQLTGHAWEQGGGWSLDEQLMTLSRTATTGPQPTGAPLIAEVAWLTDSQNARRVRITLACPPDERFYGLGERFNALNQRGNVLDVRVYEQYKDQGKRTYMPIPFLLSSAGYGLLVNSSRWMQFDLAASDDHTWTLEADLGDDESLDLTWFTDDDPFAIIGQFARSTGPMVLPPQWSFGLWMSANEWNNQARVEEEVRTSLELGIQPSVLVIEAWSDETTFYIWNDAEYDKRPGGEAFRYDDFRFPEGGRWPNPKAMADYLHDNGIKLVLWQIPVVKAIEEAHPQHDTDRAHYEQSGFGVKQADGSLYKLRPFWFRDSYVFDPTNVAERDWWFNKRAYLLEDMGVDGFKTDGGEHIWSTQLHFADGRQSDELWNEYPQRYTQAYYDFANSKREAVTFSRAGFIGSQQSPLHWAGDENSTWDAYRHSILAGLSAGISGIAFWGWDLGGFSGPIPTAELYLRGTAMAAFCPVMQYHSEYNPVTHPKQDRTPWNIQERTGDASVVETFRFFAQVRQALMPYIWQEAQYSAQSGQPMMRALQLTEPQASPYQYYFGRSLLVCPVVEPDQKQWTCYLPQGRWISLWDGAVYEGELSLVVDAPLNRIPVFYAPGSLDDETIRQLRILS